MNYRPLTAEENEKINVQLTSFYSEVKKLTITKNQFKQDILDLRLKCAEKKESFVTIARPILNFKKEILSIDTLIDKLRPATPQGELVCHSCDAKGMALLETNYRNSEADLYKCQVCGADYIHDNW